MSAKTSRPDVVSRLGRCPLPAQLRRPRPRSATRALRRHETFHDRPAVLRERRAQGGALLPPTPCPAPFGLPLYGLAIRAIIWWNGLSDCCVFGVFVGEVSLNSPGGGDVGVAARPDRLSSAWRGRAHTRSPPAWDLSSTPRRNRRWPRRGGRAADRGSRGCLDCRRRSGPVRRWRRNPQVRAADRGWLWRGASSGCYTRRHLLDRSRSLGWRDVDLDLACVCA
jgi:hypothetical protein